MNRASPTETFEQTKRFEQTASNDPADIEEHLEPGNKTDSGKLDPPSPRFHDMDSLRAAMMLLGLEFHVAWFFLPVWFGHPMSDIKGHTGYLYFFGWVHQFRMQVFFLIAGFFACLLIRKRGLLSFAKNRFVRIVIPLGLSMLTIFPLMKLQYLRGGLVSGRILSDEPLMTQYREMMTSITWSNEWIVHLWFLECLILIYAIAWVLRLGFQYVIDPTNKLRSQLERLVNHVTQSHWGPIVFAVPVALCMFYDTTWLGIDSGPINPKWAGVFAYWIFFAVGWCMYASPQIIDAFARRWPTQLIVGSVMSFILCSQFFGILMNGQTNFFYPVIMAEEIDYPSLRSSLLGAANADDKQDPHRVIWDSLSPTYQAFVRNHAEPSSDQLVGFTTELSTVTVLDPEFASRLQSESAANAGNDEFNPVANRELLARKLQGEVFGRYEYPSWYRLSYFFFYAFASWLMTFAMLGLFRRYLAHPSSSIRYLADSSYWLYLIHLPLQFEIAIHIGMWDANGILKFLIYNVLTFAILLLSYHFLVRPTWLGILLNGRLYPLRKPLPSET